MKNIGIDLGSRYVKKVKADGEKIEFERFDTVSFYKQFIKRDGDNTYIDVDKLGIDKDYTITATGYGRNLMSFSNAEIISEIKAHFRGALRQTGDTDFILIDIGGQDSKVILGKEGYIEDFIMNDKCAASTGRFAGGDRQRELYGICRNGSGYFGPNLARSGIECLAASGF